MNILPTSLFMKKVILISEAWTQTSGVKAPEDLELFTVSLWLCEQPTVREGSLLHWVSLPFPIPPLFLSVFSNWFLTSGFLEFQNFTEQDIWTISVANTEMDTNQ